MKVNIYKDEWYPVYGIVTDGYGPQIEIPQELFDRAKAAEEEFDAVQEELRKLYGDT